MHNTFRVPFGPLAAVIENPNPVLSYVEVSKIENGWGFRFSLSCSH